MGSDLVFTSSARFARYFGSLMPLRSISPPPEFGQLKFFLLWHERAQADPRNVWLRGQITAVARGLAAGTPGL